MTAPVPRAWRDGEAARPRRSDAGRPRAAIARGENPTAASGSPYRSRKSGWRRRNAAPNLNRDSTCGAPGSSPCSIASRAMSAISAASRSPILRPCAPIGGSTCAASPTSAMRCLANCRGCSIASGNRWRPGSTLTRPRMECDCRSAASDNSSSLNAIMRSASLGVMTHTTLERSPGSGTNTHGPCGV